MSKAFHAELQKGRRRYDGAMIAAVLALYLLYLMGSKFKTAEDLANGYSIAYYSLSLLNTVVTPLAMAALASRIWDAESKGQTCKLLFTLQTRSSLFWAKALLGSLENLVLCVGQGAVVLFVARAKAFTQPLDVVELAWLAAAVFCVNEMFFFFSLILSVRFANQIAALAVGFVGALIGLFSAFMPQWLAHLIPWSYHIVLCSVLAIWDPATQVSTYDTGNYRLGFLIVSVVLAAGCAAVSRHLVCDKEV